MANHYEELTERLIRQLEAGTRPWSKPWTSSAPAIACRPLRSNGAPYQGINVLSLWCATEARGLSSPYWVTFNQAKEMGAHVIKGAKGEAVFKVGTFERETDAGETETHRFVRCYIVFNASEVEGLPAHFYPAAQPAKPEAERIPAAEDFLRRTRATIQHGGNRAFYSPSFDLIRLPMIQDFRAPEAYYATALHELTHWTGAPQRVDRVKGKRFGDDGYAFEELVAEMGAAFLCADLCLPLEPRDDHASYLASWVKALRESPRILMRACGQAERACAYLHGLQASVPAVLSEAA